MVIILISSPFIISLCVIILTFISSTEEISENEYKELNELMSRINKTQEVKERLKEIEEKGKVTISDFDFFKYTLEKQNKLAKSKFLNSIDFTEKF